MLEHLPADLDVYAAVVAADWTHLGEARSSDKLDTHQQYSRAVGNIFVRPLRSNRNAAFN